MFKNLDGSYTQDKKRPLADEWEDVMDMRDAEMAAGKPPKEAALMALALMEDDFIGGRLKIYKTLSNEYEDVKQDVFLAIMQYLPQYDRSSKNFITFMYKRCQGIAREHRNGGIPEYWLKQKNVSVSSIEAYNEKLQNTDTKVEIQFKDNNADTEKILETKEKNMRAKVLCTILDTKTLLDTSHMTDAEKSLYFTKMACASKFLGGYSNYGEGMIRAIMQEAKLRRKQKKDADIVDFQEQQNTDNIEHIS